MKLHSYLLTLFIVTWASSASTQSLVQNGNTGASVDAQGKVSFYALGAGEIRQRLSFTDKSFFSVQIGSEIFTNNDSPPAQAGPLPNPTTARSADTILTIWNVNGLTLIQRVFPRYTEHGTKITVGYSAKNNGPFPIRIAGQYLLDIQVTEDNPNFFEPATGFNNAWRKFSGAMPSHIAFTPLDIRHFWVDSLLGLLSLCDSTSVGIDPSLIIAGDWTVLERMPFVPSTFEIPSNLHNDLGVLLQWNDRTVSTGETVILGAFTYGASNFTSCDENILVIAPDLLAVPVFPQSKIIRVPVYVLNSTTSEVDHPPLKLEAEGVMSFESGARMTQMPVGIIMPGKAKGLEIRITYDSTAELSTSVTSGTLITSKCPATIAFIANLHDTVPPKLSVLAGQLRECETRVDTIIAVDRTDAAESGIRSFVVSETNYAIRYLTPRIITSKEERVELTVQDSMQDASATVTAVDVAGNSSTFSIEYCTTPDTLAPQVTINYLNTSRWMVYVRDDRAWDRKLDKIEMTERNNVTTTIPNNVRGLSYTSSVVKIIDTTRPAGFCVIVHDIAGNATQKECYSYTPVSSVEEDASIIAASISPNPATDHVTLTLPSSRAHDITITDILGRVVWSGRSSETQLTINTTRFEAGKYVIRVQGDGGVVSVPMMIVK